MKYLHFSLERPIAMCLALLMITPMCATASPLVEQVPQQFASVSKPQTQSDTQAAAAQANSGSSNEISASGGQSTSESQAAPQTQQSSAANTVRQSTPPATGTALAPYQKQEGVTGSKPAGAAIAAGKQRRTRSFAIRIGLIVGAAIAIGVVAGASLASPARPN